VAGQKTNGKKRWRAFLDLKDTRGRPAPGVHLEAVYGMDLAEVEAALAEYIRRIR
jgi:hypothetical protein